MTHVQHVCVRLPLSVVLMLAVSACAPRDAAPAHTVGYAWERRRRDGGDTGASDRSQHEADASSRNERGSRPDRAGADPIATVNGAPVPRGRIVDLLLRSHGPGLLEQIIVLDSAVSLAAAKGIVVTKGDVDQEYERSLQRLVDPAALASGSAFDRTAAERALAEVLATRNISRAEYNLGIRRNAYLRAIVLSDMALTEEQLKQAYEQRYGERVQVRHIQLATLAEVRRVKERLEAGEDFGDIALRYSANIAGADDRGLLEPFSAADPAIPPLLRQTAFQLEPGAVSEAVRIGPWYHLLKLERRLPAEDVDFDAVRDELAEDVRRRRAEPAMQALYQRLFRGATVKVHDPALREAYQHRYPDEAQ